MLFLRANLLVLSVCSGQRPLKIRMPSVLPPGILIWLGMSATSFEVSKPGTLHVHLACCACSACSASHLRRFMRRTSRPPPRLAWHEALSWQPARPFFGSMELPMIRRSKSREEVSWLRRLASDRRFQTSETSLAGRLNVSRGMKLSAGIRLDLFSDPWSCLWFGDPKAAKTYRGSADSRVSKVWRGSMCSIGNIELD